MDKKFVSMARYLYEMVSSALGLLVQEIQQCHSWPSFRCLCVFYMIINNFKDYYCYLWLLGWFFFPHLQFLYNLTRIILNFNEIYKNHKIQKLKRLKNEKDLMLYLITIFELFKFDVTVFARPVSWCLCCFHHPHHFSSSSPPIQSSVHCRHF